MHSRRWVPAALTALAVALAPAAARAEVFFSPPSPDSLRLLPTTPSMQFGGGDLLGIIPMGDMGHEPWEWPVVLGQFGAGAAINAASSILFASLIESTLESPVDDVRSQMLKLGLVQLLVTPLASSLGIWGVGNLSRVYTAAFGWPTLVNYAVELLLVAMRVGVGYGLVDFKGDDTVQGLGGLLGTYLIIDWLLHGIVVPATVTYVSIKSRGARGFGFAANGRAAPAVADVSRAAVRSEAERRERTAQAPSELRVAFMPIASASF